MSRIRIATTALVLLTLAACGQARTIDTAHVATIACAADGDVHAQASQYAGGQYTLNGGEPVTFSAGFDLTLDGATTWTLVVTADDGFPTYTDSAGPCRTPSSSTTTAPATTTTCPDCVINTVVITLPPSSTTTTTTSPPTPATFAAPGGTTTTTTVVDSTTTTAAPPVTTAVVSSTTVVPTTTCPVCTAPPAPPAAGLPATR